MKKADNKIKRGTIGLLMIILMESATACNQPAPFESNVGTEAAELRNIQAETFSRRAASDKTSKFEMQSRYANALSK